MITVDLLPGMITADQRQAIYLLHQKSMKVRRIARHLNVSIHTVRSIIEQQGQIPKTIRKGKIKIDADLLTRLYNECQGHMQRAYEKLAKIIPEPDSWQSYLVLNTY